MLCRKVDTAVDDTTDGAPAEADAPAGSANTLTLVLTAGGLEAAVAPAEVATTTAEVPTVIAGVGAVDDAPAIGAPIVVPALTDGTGTVPVPAAGVTGTVTLLTVGCVGQVIVIVGSGAVPASNAVESNTKQLESRFARP